MQGVSSCPAAADLRRLLLGQVPDDQAEPIEQHLLECRRCVQALGSLKDEDAVMLALRQGSGADEVGQGAEVEALIRRVAGLGGRATPDPAGAPTLAPAPAPGAGLAPAQANDEIGRLGPYRVLKVLGEGGMGVVYAAFDTRLQRPVALKLMRGATTATAAARERFLREARAAARIEHDHIVGIYHADEEGGALYLVMPLLCGETLQARKDREGMLPLADVLRIGRETAEALAAAHEHGLVHRDIKPGNLWLEAGSGRVKVLDFGLAQAALGDVRLTDPGSIVGTPAYMAPEQTRGTPVDARSDLYSLGVVLFELCTGRLPFAHKEVLALLSALAFDAPPPVTDLCPDLPPALADLIMRLLTKEPAERPSSARAVVQAIEAIERGFAPSAAPLPAPVRRRSGWRRMEAAALLALFAGAIYFFGPAVYRIATNKGELVITTDDPDIEVVITQNGHRVRALDLKTMQRITLSAGAYEIELPGGPQALRLNTDRFTLTRGGKAVVTVERVPPARAGSGRPHHAAPGELRRLAGHTHLVASVAFAGDGRRAVSGSWDGTARVWDLSSGQQLHCLQPQDRTTVRAVAFSPDGRFVASGGFDATVWLWDVLSQDTGKELRAMRGHTKMVTALAFAPGGRALVSAGHDRTVQLWTVPLGKGVGVLRGGPGVSVGEVECVAVSGDGRQVACGGQDRLVHLWDVETQEYVRAFRGHTGPVQRIAFAPDGQRLLSAGGDGGVRVWDVANGRELHQLGNGPGAVAAFAPDGKRVLVGGRDGSLRLWDVAARRQQHQFEGHKRRVTSVAISPDGRRALSGDDEGGLRLWGLPPEQ